VNRFTCWLLVLFLFGGFVAVVVYALRARVEAGKGMPEYSVYSEEHNSLGGTARFVRRLGWEPVAMTRPLPLQHSDQPSLLIQVAPEGRSLLPGSEHELPEAEVRALLRWVEQGNTLLLCGRTNTTLHRSLDVSVNSDSWAGGEDVFDVTLGEAGGYTDGVHRVLVEGRDTVQANAGLPLWWLDDTPGAILMPHGKGRVLVVADPSLLTPRGLRRGDNTVFLYNVLGLHARDGRVYFDEYHHGLRSGGGFWDYLRYHKQHWLVLAVLALVAMAVWSVAIRLGPAVPTPHPARADAVDYASAVARIYQRAGVRRSLARSLSRGFLAALTRHLHLRRAALPAEVLAAWRQRHAGDSAKRVHALLRGTAELRKGDVTEPQLLAWARAFDQFESEVLRAR
jgi:hypothetical protein